MRLDAKSLGYAILRVSLGMMFFLFGLTKFLEGHGQFVESMTARFAKTPLPHAAVRLFAEVNPFVELILGVLLLLGLCTITALVLAGALMISLNFGLAWLGEAGIMGHNTIYVMAVFLLLYTSEHNTLALDSLLRKRKV